MYAMNSQFNLQDSNEERLPWDYFGREYGRRTVAEVQRVS